jgi:malonyl-CoA O-methyltransferase
VSRSRTERIRAAFDRAAPRYEESAVLQREVTSRLSERLQYIKVKPQRVLDLGAGTGTGTRALRKQYPAADIAALDISPEMLQQLESRAGLLERWRGRTLTVCADAQELPFPDHSFGLVFSSLTLQWCASPARVFQEIFRVLQPGGALAFSTLGPDTLHELRASWAAVDAGRHVNDFIDMHLIGDMLVAAGFADPVMDMEHITLTYKDVAALLRDIKQIGANTVLDGEAAESPAESGPRGLTGKGRLAAMRQAYEAYRTAEGQYPVTYEIVYGLAWGRDPAVQAMRFVPPEALAGR